MRRYLGAWSLWIWAACPAAFSGQCFRVGLVGRVLGVERQMQGVRERRMNVYTYKHKIVQTKRKRKQMEILLNIICRLGSSCMSARRTQNAPPQHLNFARATSRTEGIDRSIDWPTPIVCLLRSPRLPPSVPPSLHIPIGSALVEGLERVVSLPSLCKAVGKRRLVRSNGPSTVAAARTESIDPSIDPLNSIPSINPITHTPPCHRKGAFTSD